MYTCARHAARARIRSLALLLALALPPLPGCADELPPFSPPGSLATGAHSARGYFVQRDGAALYRAICQACHMPDARGAQGAGMYPALAANPKLASAAYPTLTVLQGRRAMPAFGDSLSDEQVAEVVNYVRSHFDNRYADTIRSEDVARLRASSP
ncbi:MAG TPA: cytochrome c [Rudaea sp.]|nr:cytochrome c [Rudaea sp.]